MRSFLERFGIRYDISDIANAYYREEFNRIAGGAKGGDPSPLPDRREVQGQILQGRGGPLRRLQTVPLR